MRTWGWIPLSALLALDLAYVLVREPSPAPPERPWTLDLRVPVPVLCYHGIVVRPTSAYEVSVVNLRKQLRELRRLGFNAITARQAVRGLRGEIRLPSRPIVLSFDDGLGTAISRAAPVLAEQGWPGTAFINPGYVGGPRPSWEEWKALADKGWDLECHGMNHLRLIQESGESDEAWKARFDVEVVRAKALMEEKLGREVRVLAYPYGLYDKDSAREIKDAGFEAAFGLNGGVNDSGRDPFMLDRILVLPATSLETFRNLVTSRPLRLKALEPGNGEVVRLKRGKDSSEIRLRIGAGTRPEESWKVLVQGQALGLTWGHDQPGGELEARAGTPFGRGARIGQVVLEREGREYRYAWLFWIRTLGR